MKSISISGVVALTLLLMPCAAHAQGQQIQIQTTQIGPGGDGMIQLPGPGRQLKTGTGRIRGRLLNADTGTLVRRAQGRGVGQDIMPKVSVTDAEGSWEYRDLA